MLWEGEISLKYENIPIFWHKNINIRNLDDQIQLDEISYQLDKIDNKIKIYKKIEKQINEKNEYINLQDIYNLCEEFYNYNIITNLVNNKNIFYEDNYLRYNIIKDLYDSNYLEEFSYNNINNVNILLSENIFVNGLYIKSDEEMRDSSLNIKINNISVIKSIQRYIKYG